MKDGKNAPGTCVHREDELRCGDLWLEIYQPDAECAVFVAFSAVSALALSKQLTQSPAGQVAGVKRRSLGAGESPR
jgi:hypothetical protein